MIYFPMPSGCSSAQLGNKKRKIYFGSKFWLGDDDLKTVQPVFWPILFVGAGPISENTYSHYHLPTIAAEKPAQESQT
jgi:hypothetical protein